MHEDSLDMLRKVQRAATCCFLINVTFSFLIIIIVYSAVNLGNAKYYKEGNKNKLQSHHPVMSTVNILRYMWLHSPLFKALWPGGFCNSESFIFSKFGMAYKL